jgi:hypothetical protein
MYHVPNPLAWQQAVTDFAMKQWQQVLQAQAAALSLLPKSGENQEAELQEHDSLVEKRLEWLEQKVTNIDGQEPRLIFLEHELASLRSELAELKKTVSAGSANSSSPAAKPRGKSQRSKTSKDDPVVEI